MTKLISWSKENQQLFSEVISKCCQHDENEQRYYDKCMPAILSRPYVLSLGCLADPGQPSTPALLGEPSAQNWMGRIQLCPHSYPKMSQQTTQSGDVLDFSTSGSGEFNAFSSKFILDDEYEMCYYNYEYHQHQNTWKSSNFFNF